MNVICVARGILRKSTRCEIKYYAAIGDRLFLRESLIYAFTNTHNYGIYYFSFCTFIILMSRLYCFHRIIFMRV